MKYIIPILMLVVWSVQAKGQGNFDPPTPPEPGILYSLTLKASPTIGGNVSFNESRQFNFGESVGVNAYAGYGYTFVCWKEGEKIVSENQSFNYVIPDHNSTLTACFKFNPQLPAEPDTMPTKRYHLLYLAASPSVGGSFNLESGRSHEEGSKITVQAYPNTGYAFEGWQINNQFVSRESAYTVSIGKENSYLTGVFRFDPVTPSNPGANHWNATTGEIIVDDFSLGYLSTAIDNTIGGSGNRSKVTMAIISGRMDASDFGLANYLTNCTLLDLSRTGGYTAIPDYAFDYTNLNSVIIPACVEHVGNGAFSGCKNLTDITCYAITPPTLGYNVFSGMNEGAVLHVLSSSISLYSEAEGWKDFTILPLTEEVRTLEVALPANSEDGRYKNMTLELVNVQSGQKQKYVISDRLKYTFNGLLKNSSYHVYVKNQQGIVLGKLEGVEIKDENVSVAFESLLTPQTVNLKILTPEGEDVTSLIQNTWFAADNVYLQQGVSLYGLVAGTEIKYKIVLPQKLGMQYIVPTELSYVVKEKDNTISYTLTPIREVTITGTVKEGTNGNILSGATVSVSQLLNGKYSKAFTVKTDAKGAFSAKVYNDVSTITVSAIDYVSQTIEKQNFDNATNIGEIVLKSITGATINTTLTYTPSVEEGQTAETQNWYTDYANIAYSIFNETQNRAVLEFSVQYPSIVLLEEVAEGDKLRITATSKTNSFVPVTAIATIDAQNRGEVIFPIIELGVVKASFASTNNAVVVAILYDGKGQLIKKYNYNNATLSITNLADGNYTLVSMTNSILFNSVLNLAQLSGSGLKEGIDYVQNSVTVKSGRIVKVTNELIPVLDESKLYYTGDKTLFSVNKPSIVAGNYLTLKGQIDFKNTFASQVRDVKMIIDLPESSSFVENSVMVGSKVASYTLDGTRLTIPLEKYSDQVRFCIIPTVGGEYSPNAFVAFTFGDKEVLQPIGAANFTVKDLTITVPKTVAKTSIPISGTAIGNSAIEIYDNGILVGQTTSLANGVWATTCDLNEPYNLSTHSVYAKIKTKQGLELQSETMECIYDKNAIQVMKVIMYHDNPEIHKTFEVVFDFQNPTSEAQKYTYYIYNKVFTFTIEFTDNDPEKISDVILNVKTGDGSWTPLKAVYDDKKQLWIASQEFGNMYDGNIPVNVAVDYEAEVEIHADRNQLDDSKAEVEDLADNYNNLLQQLSEAEKDETGNSLKELADKLDISLDIDTNDEESIAFAAKLDAMSEEEFDAYNNILNQEISTFLKGNQAYIDSIRTEMNCDQHINLKTEDGASMILSNCSEYRKSDLLEKGFVALPLTSGDTIYIYQTDSLFISVDFDRNQSIKVLFSREASDKSVDEDTRQSAKNRDIYKLIHNAILAINESVNSIKGFQTDLMNRLFQSTSEIEKADKAITSQLNKAINYLNKSKDPLKQAFWKAKIISIQTQKLSNAIALNVAKCCKPILRKVIPIADYLDMANKLCNDIRTVGELYLSIPEPCPNDQDKADVLAMQCTSLFGVFAAYATGRLMLRAQADAKIATGVVAALPTGGTSLLATLWGLVDKVVLSLALDFAYDKTRNAVIRKLSSDISNLKCENAPTTPDGDGSNNGNSKGHGQNSGSSDADPSIDPSGYVYEAVSTNRLQGVTATAYYKETVEDMYGDLHEQIVLWDAAEYAQENPLFTDENGMYAWDVPQGLWQVKFEKEGYQTTYSDWLPVPPPQLEVNIPMTQNAQPVVKNVRAYEDGIEVEFDKYMLPDVLNTDHIFAIKNGKAVSGTVKLMNKEQAYQDNEAMYASKVRFVPETPFLTTDEITFTVSRKVKSYAGIQMESDYNQAFDIEKEVKSIVVDSLIKVPYNGSKQIRVSALPYEAAIGKKLVAHSSSSMITTVTEEAVLDKNGQATLTLTGELPGTSVITFSIENVDVQGLSVVNVTDVKVTQTATPTASRASGTAVYRHTEVSLNCETKDAVIYYTIDGSCPCDENGTRQVYTAPIAITEDVTIKAMAMEKEMEASEVATFMFTIKKTTLGLDLKSGWNWISHTLETGVPVTTLSENAVRIIGQSSETRKDPSSGFIGDLVVLSPAETYKMQVSDYTSYTLSGYEFNAEGTPVILKNGWNWIGYPVSQILTVNEAFANAEPDEMDYIFSRDGFTQYIDGRWTGTLQTLKPGGGYLYHSQSEKTFVYNTSVVSKSKSLYTQTQGSTSVWTVDKYAYPDVMCVIAELYADGKKLDASRYALGAFCGTECRGIGQYVEGKLLMTIYGSNNEKITFRVIDNEDKKEYNIVESEKFAEVLLGDLRIPYVLHIGDEHTGIRKIESGWKVYPTVVSDRIYVSTNSDQAIDRVSFTDIYGNTLLRQEKVEGDSGIKVSGLPDGVYIVTVAQGGYTFYQKIVKLSK